MFILAYSALEHINEEHTEIMECGPLLDLAEFVDFEGIQEEIEYDQENDDEYDNDEDNIN